MAGEPNTIAYMTSAYARASDTFIRGEVRELRRLGYRVETFSIRSPEPGEDVGAEVARERRSTDYILDHGAPRLLYAFLRMAVRSPIRMISAIRLAWRTAVPGVRGAFLELAYLVEASYLAERLLNEGVRHIHNHFGEGCASVTMLASLLSGVPYSLALHGPSVFFDPVHYCLGEKVARSDFTTCISHFCMSQCMAFTAPEAWDRLRLVRCGVGEKFLSQEPQPIPEISQIVCVGRLSPEKGHLILVRAVARLAATGRSVSVRVVGDGPMRTAIEAEARQLGVGESFHVLGWTDAEAVKAEILASRALVVSSFAEGLPVVIMEALALGRPVLSTRVGGIAELVTPSECGWLVAPGAVDELSCALEELLSASTAELEEMGRRGRQRVARLHDAAAEAKKLAGHIDESIRTARGRGL
jgi:glycosyltransferase involved in cell wall biosynthesis